MCVLTEIKELVVTPFMCNCLIKDVHSPVHEVLESGKSLRLGLAAHPSGDAASLLLKLKGIPSLPSAKQREMQSLPGSRVRLGKGI